MNLCKRVMNDSIAELSQFLVTPTKQIPDTVCGLETFPGFTILLKVNRFEGFDSNRSKINRKMSNHLSSCNL